MIYVILGMHKSGTTLLAQMLHLSDINMIDEVESTESVYDHLHANPADRSILDRVDEQTHYFFERASINRLNQDILIHSGAQDPHSNVESLFNIPAPGTLVLNPQDREGMQGIIAACESKYKDWGFKDPRTCLTYPLWSQVLPAHKLIVVYRSYTEILRHYKIVGWKQMNLPRVRKVLDSWTHHNLQIIETLKTTKYPFLVIRYEDFMNGSQDLERLNRFVGSPVVDKRNMDLYRRRSSRTEMTMLEKAATLGLNRNPNVVLEQLGAFR